jgi:hypothetical protein
MTNQDIEEAWIAAWDRLYQLIGGREGLLFALPDWREVSREELEGWIQDQAYDGYRVCLEQVWLRGRPAVRAVSREPISADFPEQPAETDPHPPE